MGQLTEEYDPELSKYSMAIELGMAICFKDTELPVPEHGGTKLDALSPAQFKEFKARWHGIEKKCLGATRLSTRETEAFMNSLFQRDNEYDMHAL